MLCVKVDNGQPGDADGEENATRVECKQEDNNKKKKSVEEEEEGEEQGPQVETRKKGMLHVMPTDVYRSLLDLMEQYTVRAIAKRLRYSIRYVTSNFNEKKSTLTFDRRIRGFAACKLRIPRESVVLSTHGFSKWMTMLVSNDQYALSQYVRRVATRLVPAEGLRLQSVQDVPYLPGIYEWATWHNNGDDFVPMPVYIGMTTTETGLRGRLEQYLRDGSHLMEKINHLLVQHGMCLLFRFKVIMGNPMAEEQYYLHTYLYKWNTANNAESATEKTMAQTREDNETEDEQEEEADDDDSNK
jgi:hypothetical protein